MIFLILVCNVMVVSCVFSLFIVQMVRAFVLYICMAYIKDHEGYRCYSENAEKYKFVIAAICRNVVISTIRHINSCFFG